MSDVRKPDFGYAGQILPHVAIANSLQSPHTEKLAFLPNPLSAFFIKPACCLKNCDRDKKSSFSTVSTQIGFSLWRFPCTFLERSEHQDRATPEVIASSLESFTSLRLQRKIM